MALRDQPYLPLYIKDFLTDEKLVHCSPAANGVLIRLMCLLHKEETYGKVLLQQKYRQTDQQILESFSVQIGKVLPWDSNVIHAGLEELFAAGVIQIRGHVLSQKRMVRDGEISDKRASSGKEGGKTTAEKNKKFAATFATANSQANSANANAIESDTPSVLKNIKKEPAKTIKMDFQGTETTLPFDTFWELYDKKIGRKACEKKWVAVSEADRVKIADHVPRYKEAQPDKQYRKDPETFLNNASWNDEIILRNATTSTPPTASNGKMGTSAARVDALKNW